MDESEEAKAYIEELTSVDYGQIKEQLNAYFKKSTCLNDEQLRIWGHRLLNIAEDKSSLYFKGWRLLCLADSSRRNKDYKTSLRMAKMALATFEELKDINGIEIAKGMMRILDAYISEEPEKLNTAILVHFIKQQRGEDSKEIFRATYNLGDVYLGLNDFSNALKCYMQAFQMASNENNKSEKAAALNKMGITYERQGDSINAFGTYFTALDLYEELVDKKGMAETHQNIGLVYFSEKNYGRAINSYLKALDLFQALDSKWQIVECCRLIVKGYENWGWWEGRAQYKVLEKNVLEEIAKLEPCPTLNSPPVPTNN